MVSIQPPKLFHSNLDGICVKRVSRIVRHLGLSPVAGLVLPFTDKHILMLVNVLPTEHLFSRFIIFVSPDGEAAIIHHSTRNHVDIDRAMPCLSEKTDYRFEQTHSQRGL